MTPSRNKDLVLFFTQMLYFLAALLSSNDSPSDGRKITLSHTKPRNWCTAFHICSDLKLPHGLKPSA